MTSIAERLVERTAADTDGEVRDHLEHLEASGKRYRMVQLLANAPTVFPAFVGMASALVNSTFPARERELVILHLAARIPVPYAWQEHVRTMSAGYGVTEAELDTLSSGTLEHLSQFGASERLALTACGELMRDGSLSEETWDSVTAAWGPEGALELILIVAWWGGFVPPVLTALGL